MKFWKKALCASAVGVATLAQAQPAPQAVTVYSSRIENLLKPTLDQYTQQTGVKINLLTDRGGSLSERLAAEGKSSPADVLITVDMGNLHNAAERGLLRRIDSPMLNANVPANFRDPGNRWWGLSQRERTIFYAADRVKPAQLSTYEDLADPKWKGKLCLRTSKQTYTQSLVAMMIAKHGVQQAEAITRGWVNNLAGDVFTNDNSLLKAIAAGQCDVGIANTYYYGRILSREPEFGQGVKLFWANQERTRAARTSTCRARASPPMPRIPRARASCSSGCRPKACRRPTPTAPSRARSTPGPRPTRSCRPGASSRQAR
ncbi:extracellular solute-binding protein [Comamonas endophytica]|uniref:extracellular solute-binding protein n=1 Tax=Comamonas endophytica TaxID=2949090 RepID=UPI00361CF521